MSIVGVWGKEICPYHTPTVLFAVFPLCIAKVHFLHILLIVGTFILNVTRGEEGNEADGRCAPCWCGVLVENESNS